MSSLQCEMALRGVTLATFDKKIRHLLGYTYINLIRLHVIFCYGLLKVLRSANAVKVTLEATA